MDLWKDLITLLAVVDPIGTIPIYLTATMGMPVAAQRKVAVRATLIAAGVLTAFIVAGQIVLNAMGISLSAYQVAGGIVLFLFALQMVFDPGSHSQEADQSKGHDVAVFPIAIPSIAGPAAMMAVVILTDNSRFNVMEQAQTSLELYAVLGLYAGPDACRDPSSALIGDRRGEHRAAVMGLILAALAVADGGRWHQQLVEPGMINMKKILPPSRRCSSSSRFRRTARSCIRWGAS